MTFREMFRSPRAGWLSRALTLFGGLALLGWASYVGVNAASVRRDGLEAARAWPKTAAPALRTAAGRAERRYKWSAGRAAAQGGRGLACSRFRVSNTRRWWRKQFARHAQEGDSATFR